jgi:carbonic anhydrase/acetyltransferase-like protein (isoleucine patch superfamily)
VVPIYALGNQVPQIATDAFIHPEAVIIGSVTIGAGSSVWPSAVLRGDEGEIRIGRQTSVQDGSVLHTTPDDPTVVGDRCVVGHIVHLEACTIEDDVLVGNGSIVLHRAIARSWSIIAANSVVLNDTEIPSGAIAAGSPAVVKLDRAKREIIESGVAAYVERAQRFRSELRRLD